MYGCQDVELLLAEYAAGDLSGELIDLVTDHLAVCENCRRELSLERRLRDRLAGLPDRRLSAAVTAELHQVPHGVHRLPSDRRRSGMNRLAVSGLIAAAVLLIVLLPTTGPGPDTKVLETQVVAAAPDLTPAQLATVRRDALWSLAKTAKIIDKSERATISDVLGRRLPQTITGSLRQAFDNNQGGQG